MSLLPSAAHARSKLITEAEKKAKLEEAARDCIRKAYVEGEASFVVHCIVPISVMKEMIELGWKVDAVQVRVSGQHNMYKHGIRFSLPSIY